jgi:glycerophosphoryl diester phosphodiesterase
LCREEIEAMKAPYWSGKYPVMVIAHRGFSGATPENTLASFQKAIEIGSDMIELDVQLSKDGKLVVLHDDTLDRTTNGQGRVVDYDLQELKKLDAGSWLGAQFSGEKIPTLEEVLDLAKGRVLVNIEIKHPEHGQYPITELADQALKGVKKAGVIDQVIFSSFNPAALEWIKKNEPRVWVALLYHRAWNSLPEVTGGKQYSVLNLRNSYLTKTKIDKIRREGLRVNVYTVNSEEELEQFVRWGVDGIITNHPDRLINILKKKSG